MADDLVDPGARDQWHTEGWCVLEDFFPAADLAAAQQDLHAVFPPVDEVLSRRSGTPGEGGTGTDPGMPRFPFEGAGLNALVVHDRLIGLAQDLLGTDQVRLYQGMVGVKYPGGPPDDEQLLHADYGNHTLVVPRTDAGFQHLELFVYLSDVTPDTAATRMVSRRLTGDIPVERTYLALDEYAALYGAEVPAVGPAGSVLAYRPDVYHRGVSLRSPDRARYLLHVAYKPAGTDWVGFHAWPGAAEGMAWHRFVPTATPRQLAVLGFPEPGHPYWTEETLRGVAARYPRLDMAPWRQAASVGGRR